MYESIINRIHNFANGIIIDTDQNFDYIKTGLNKNWTHL